MVSKIKELRVSIDGSAQLVETLYEKEQAITVNLWNCSKSLILAKGWLGKLLGELGTANPYGSGYKTVEDIVPTQDVNMNSIDGRWVQMNTIEKLDWLRISIEILCNEVKELGIREDSEDINKFVVNLITREQNICRANAWTYLCEAKMWLGFELGKIRDAK